MLTQKQISWPLSIGVFLFFIASVAVYQEQRAVTAAPSTIVPTPTATTSAANNATARILHEPIITQMNVLPTQSVIVWAEPDTIPTPFPTVTIAPTAMAQPTIVAPTPATVAKPTEAPAVFNWLDYLNEFRTIAGLLPLVENSDLTVRSQEHSKYMVRNRQAVHFKALPRDAYTRGDIAASDNIAFTQNRKATDAWPINFWISAPFHLVPMIDPTLREVGYGIVREATVASVLNMKKNNAIDPLLSNEDGSNLSRQFDSANEAPSLHNPILFPGHNSETWVIQHSLFEVPSPRPSCPNLPAHPVPIGPPIVAQIGLGQRTPDVTSSRFSTEGVPLPHCIIDETNYVNPSATQQRNGRLILDQRDAIVLMPLSPLEIGKTYTVHLVVNSVEIQWHFTAVNPSH